MENNTRIVLLNNENEKKKIDRWIKECVNEKTQNDRPDCVDRETQMSFKWSNSREKRKIENYFESFLNDFHPITIPMERIIVRAIFMIKVRTI